MKTKVVFKSGGPQQSGEKFIAGIGVFCIRMDKVRKSMLIGSPCAIPLSKSLCVVDG